MIYSSKDRIFGAPPTHGMYIDRADFGGAAPPTTWVPTDEPGGGLWYRYDGKNTSGSTVTKWLDQFGNGRDLTYLVGRQPTWDGLGMHGHDRVIYDFDSGGTISSGSDNFIGTTGACTIIWVLKGAPYPATNPLIINLVAASGKEIRIQMVPAIPGSYNELTFEFIGTSTNTVGIAYNSIYTTGHYIIIRFNGGNPDLTANWSVIINGVSQTISTAPGLLGAILGVNSHGTQGGGTSGYNPGGAHEELIVYDHYVADAVIPEIEAYIADQYAALMAPMPKSWMQRNRKWLIAASAFGAALAGAGALWHYALM